jgi:hypothetical protein
MYNKKLLQQITGSLDKAKAPKKPNDIIVDPRGQWDHPGEITRIPSNEITMQGVDYPVYGVPNVGEPQMMLPGAEYMFPGADYVDEYPQMRRGGAYTTYNKLPKNYGRSRYSSNISATNKLFARNFLFRKEKHKIYDPNAKYEQGGIPNLPLTENRRDYNLITRSFEPKHQDGGFMELDLTPEQIEEYAQGGYIIEDVSIPSLTKAQRGLFKKKDKQDPNKLEYREPVKVEDDLVESVTPFPEAPEDFKKGVANLKEVEAGPYWLNISREYSNKHNKQAFIDKKKRQYLRNTNRGLAKAAGLNMENFPKDVEKNFINEYNYKRNNYVVKNLFKKAGISPNKREEWVDSISDADRALIKNSKYGNKLSPSIWARTLAGLGTLASKFSPEIDAAMERGDLPGLTREEQRAIKNAKIKGIPVGGLEALAGTDAVGIAIANAVEASGNESYGSGYKEAPSLISGDVMPNITDDQIAVLNPFTYTAGYDIPMLGKALLTGAKNIPKIVSKSKNITKPAVNTVTEIAEAPTRIVAPPSIPQRPTTSAQVISNRFDELSNTYDALTARAKLIDEFGMEDVQRAFSNQYSQPSHSGSINLRRSGNNQLPPPPAEITIDPSITGTNFRQRSLEDDMQSVINEINLNVNHPEYRIEDSYDDLLNTLTTNPRYTPEDIERVRNNNRYRTAFTDLKNQQRSFADYQNAVANRNTSSNPFGSSAQEYISGSYRPSEQNINVSNRYADKINKIAAQILRPQEFLTLNNAVVGSPAKTAAKKLSKKFNTAKDLVKETLEKANVNIGKLIDKSKIESLKDPIKPKDIDTEVNKLLESGLGVKKGDIKIKVNTKSNGQTQVLLQPYDFFKNNKKLIEDVYGEGTFDEWIKTIDKDAWIDSGYLGLGSTSGEMLKPRTFTEILSGKKAKPTIDFGSYGNVEIPTPGLKRAGDFPFEKWDYNFRQNILDNLGVSGEISQAYKKALQSKGYNIYSGGTGHLMPGAKRYVRELLNNRVEVMNPKAAEDLIILLNDPNVLRDVNVSLKNKNVPLPEVVRNAINPVVFKYKKKGGQIQNYFELDLTPEEIEDYRKQGYIIEDVD